MALLDTCALLWLAYDQDALSRRAMAAIRESDAGLSVCAITAFEIAWKVAMGKLKVPLPPGPWYAEAKRTHTITEIPLTGELCIRAAELPLIHRDPCDRFIVATALAHRLPVVTPDPFIRRYPGVKVIW